MDWYLCTFTDMLVSLTDIKILLSRGIFVLWRVRIIYSKEISQSPATYILSVFRHEITTQDRTILEVVGNKQVCNHCATVSPLVFTVWQNANRKQWETTYNTHAPTCDQRKKCMQGNIRTHNHWRMYCPGEDNQLSCSETGDVTPVHKRITLFHARHQGDQPRFRIIFSVDKTIRVAVGWQTLVVF